MFKTPCRPFYSNRVWYSPEFWLVNPRTNHHPTGVLNTAHANTTIYIYMSGTINYQSTHDHHSCPHYPYNFHHYIIYIIYGYIYILYIIRYLDMTMDIIHIYIYIVILEYIEYGNLKKHIIKMETVLRNLCFLLQDYYITIYKCEYMYIYICIKHIYIYISYNRSYI